MSVEIRNVSVSIDGRSIVRPTTLTVGESSVAGVLGPNGSGKTTLLRTIYRVLKPDGGTVTVAENDIWRISPRDAAKSVAAVCQDHFTTYDLTVGELVRLGRYPHKGPFDSDDRRDEQIVAGAMAQVGISEMANRRLSELSGGERQRAVIARGLAQEPHVLVLDEPTNHLDVRFQVEVLALLKRLRKTVIVTLHDVNLAAAYCDTLHLVLDGAIAAAGAPREVLTAETVRRVFGVETVVGVNPLTGRPHLFFGHAADSPTCSL
jgi:iron complex transport system ATP-binding protein